MSHALATVLHRGLKAATNVHSACLASSRGAQGEKGALRGGARGVPKPLTCRDHGGIICEQHVSASEP